MWLLQLGLGSSLTLGWTQVCHFSSAGLCLLICEMGGCCLLKLSVYHVVQCLSPHRALGPELGTGAQAPASQGPSLVVETE